MPGERQQPRWLQEVTARLEARVWGWGWEWGGEKRKEAGSLREPHPCKAGGPRHKGNLRRIINMYNITL